MYKLSPAVFFCFLILAACSPETEHEPAKVLAGLEAIQITGEFDSLAGNELSAFRRIVHDARIVSLGQSRHDAHEQLAIQALLSRNLIADFGFKTIILEESFAHCLSLDAYVSTGEGDLRMVLGGLAGWYLWDTEEMVAFFEWVRDYNSSLPRDRHVRVFGMDITAPAPGIRRAATVAKDLRAEPKWVELEYGLYLHAGDMWPQTLGRYAGLGVEEAEAIGQNLENLSHALASQAAIPGATFEVQLAAIQAEIGARAHDMFTANGMAAIGAARESGMAYVVDWLLADSEGKPNAVIWTHNLHAAKSDFRMPQLAEGDLTPMGVLLHERYGDEYVAIGASFGTGEYPGDLPPGQRSFALPESATVDGAIGELGHDAVLLDLTETEAARESLAWLASEREWRMQDSSATLSPGKSFDAIYYVRSISRAQLTPGALQRHAGNAR